MLEKTACRRGLVRVTVFAGLLAAYSSSFASHGAPKMISDMSAEERTSLLHDIETSVATALGGRSFSEDDALPVTARIRLDSDTNLVVVDLDERLGPKALSDDMQDLAELVRYHVIIHLDRIDGITGIHYTYGGFDREHWPENQKGDQSPRSSLRKRREATQPVAVVSPGHGIYFHSTYKDWRAQRETVNGILEDELTPVLAAHLTSDLERDRVSVHNLRETSQVFMHQPSSNPWWKMGARYLLEAKMPDKPEIWNSRPDDRRRDRERREDLRSRPLYANYVNADALLQVHTNAEATGKASGLRVIVHPRAADKRLAGTVLCSARELIHTKQEFAAYGVQRAPEVASDNIENGLADMPSVIVEVGFHTNPSDAEHLKNHDFQQLAMRGVAKGYRLFRENKPCEDFAVEAQPDVVGNPGIDVKFPVTIRGNPLFPVGIWTKESNCTREKGCESFQKSVYNLDGLAKYKVGYLCKREDLDKPPVEITVRMKDFDGVVSKPAVYRVQCARRTAARR
ncbi:N-acetylmuramoyl-L-alanine amidase family protein [Luteibacter yeojuensis]|uniref:N-acetylmuramoyl-L-alanine amidase n=1 Tax=Luteibacter yeojuensis TaxID=345309 RepID=A0A0F3L243_9GAMM|nr:N-acetylmuramoyl-L-alanine amidase [Luteibacter yeojuensis]KJV37292.1 hypothetical protein VI08_00270 [Luteibacter yeojuensis]